MSAGNIAFLLLVLSACALAQSDCSTLNFCSNHGQCTNGVCVCHAGWGFDDCSMSTTNCPNNCYGHGDCLNGVCTCQQGFSGAECNLVVELCPKNCTGHGICQDGQCTCFPGLWTGEACDVEIYRCPESLNHCNGKGQCAPINWENETSAWACTCDAGFCGDSCNLVCGGCPNNCSAHGVCTSGACSCNRGFAGDDCSLVAPITTCPNNCSGHGHCLSVNGTHRCVCSDCYTGADCSRSSVFCPNNCSGHGVCDCSGHCVCRAGYQGLACEAEVAICEELNYCSGNGLCDAGKCKCSAGFAGSMCNLACPAPSANASAIGCTSPSHGTCFEQNGAAVCVCKPEYQGEACETPKTTGLLDEYVNGHNPIGTVVLALVACAGVVFIGGLFFNFSQGKRGLKAVPGFSNVASRVTSDEYEALQGASQRNVSNY